MAERKRISSTSSNKKSAQNKKNTGKAAPNTKKTELQSAVSREICAIVILALGVFLILGFYFDPLCGVLGKWLKTFGLGLFGVSGYVLPFVITALGVCFFFRKEDLRKKGYYILGLFICLSALTHLFSPYFDEKIPSLFTLGTDSLGGGLIGGLLYLAFSFAGRVGSAVIFIAAICIFLILITGITLFADIKKTVSEKIADKKSVLYEDDDKIQKNEHKNFTVKDTGKKEPIKGKKKIKEEVSEDIPEPEFKIYTGDQVGIEEAAPEESKKTAEELMRSEMEENAVTAETKNEPPVSEKEIADEIEASQNELPYEFPPLEMLTEKAQPKNKTDKPEDLRESAKKLIDTLKSFGVEAQVIEVTRGPNVTRFEIKPSAGVKVSKIVNLADDIALNLAAIGVRIEAPIPGKAAVGIEIPNKTSSMVSLREVIASNEFKNFKSKTAFGLGKDISGRPVVADISKMPHLLIAGTTGSGKSVCINTLITSIIYKASPSEVKLLMIDPKVVELSVYNGIPHLLIPVVTDPRKAAGALNWAVTEMVNRYKMFAECNVRDMHGYNEYAETEGLKKLESIIIIIDELSDLMMVAPHDVEDAICRLAQMARAAGMHLVIATQRPSVDVITGLIKANVPSRIAFTVSNQIDSRTILDMTGAEKLLGKGDMLFLPVGASKPTRIQGAFISDKEVEHIVEFIKGDYEPHYDEDILDKIENADRADADEEDSGDADEYLTQAIEIVIECGQASVSLIQRKLKVGYARAGRIIDQMEMRGIIGPHEGSKPRNVLITKAQWHEMMMNTETEE